MKIIFLRTEEIRSRHRVCSLERLDLLCKVFAQEHDQERQRSESPDAHRPDSLASTSGKQQRDPASKRTESVVSGTRVLHPYTLSNSNYCRPDFRSLDADKRTRKDRLEMMRATDEVGNVLKAWHLRKTWFQSNFGFVASSRHITPKVEYNFCFYYTCVLITISNAVLFIFCSLW